MIVDIPFAGRINDSSGGFLGRLCGIQLRWFRHVIIPLLHIDAYKVEYPFQGWNEHFCNVV
jgi:hypothetical protein